MATIKNVIINALSDMSKLLLQNDKTVYDELRGRADTSDVNVAKLEQNLNDKIELKADKTEISVERKRIDALTSLPSGSTSGDAELMDIRVGVDGSTYDSAGTSVREQVKGVDDKLKTAKLKIAENLKEKADLTTVPRLTIDEYWNILEKQDYEEIREHTYINMGTLKDSDPVSANYYTYMYIPVISSTLYRFNDSEYGSGQARFVNFYDKDKNYISGLSEKFNATTPSNCVYMCITFKYKTDTSEYGTTFVTTKNSNEHVNKTGLHIPDGFVLPLSNIEKRASKDKFKFAEHRIGTINFQFDDGHVNDASIVNIFRANKKTCGFALLSTNTRTDEYLSYQDEGFEILSHSIDSTGMSDGAATEEEIAEKLKTSKSILTEKGFEVRGWVTPSSTMNSKYIPYLKKYYDFGYTLYWGDLHLSNYTNDKNTDTCKLWRISLQSQTLDEQKQAVDEAIANCGFLTFYGHSAGLDGTDNLTTSNLNSLLEYIQTKIDASECYLLSPSDAVDYYFHVRHSDYLELLNK